MAKLVMVIEDEREIRDLIRRQLARAGFRMSAISDGEEGLRDLFASRHDAVALDLTLPGRSGLEAPREARGEPSTRDLPVVVLTSRSTVEGEPPHGVRVGAVLWAVRQSGLDSAQRLSIDREESSRNPWRVFPRSRPETGPTAADAWGMSERRILAGVSGDVHERGGPSPRFRRIERYDARRHDPDFRLRNGIVIVAASEHGEEERQLLVHAVAERVGRFEDPGTMD